MNGLLLIPLLALQLMSDLPITSLSFDGKELKKSFNGSTDVVRVVTVMSPT